MGLLDKVRSEITRHHLLASGDLVLVGVSGGPDSVALLHLLFSLREELNIQLHVAHLNHMFRGEEAKGDASFVRDLAERWNLPCTVRALDVPAYGRERNLSAQVAAREVRYCFFREVLRATGANKLALGHHADDQAESVLMNLFRGSGLQGLAGMAPMRENLYIRPLLAVRRREIEEYCREHQLATRLDPSNLKSIYLRNKIRNRLLPLLEEEYCPGIVPVLARMAGQLRDEHEFLEQLSRQAYRQIQASCRPGQVVLDRQALSLQPRALARRMIRLAWEEIQGNRQDLTFDHVEDILERLEKGGPEKILELPCGVKAKMSLQTVTLFKGDVLAPPQPFLRSLKVPGRTELPEAGACIVVSVVDRQEVPPDLRELSSGTIALDYERITLPLMVRSRRQGDVLVPFGLGKEVKLKKLFIDRKVPRGLRDRIPLVIEESTGRILWAAGVRMAAGIEITAATRKVILLSLENGNSNNT